jgi:serine phosphatase RsbU (regulator of sigma subunit)
MISFIGIALVLDLLTQNYGLSVFEGTNYTSGFLIPLDFFYFRNYGMLFTLTTGPFYIMSILVFISLISKILKIKLLIIEHLYCWILKFYLILFTISLTLGIWFMDYSPKLVRTIGLVIFTTILYRIINRYLKLFPFINPVRFNAKKMLIKLLNISYDYTDHNEYTQFFYEYLKKIQSKAKICIISENSFVGDEFPQLKYSRLKEVLSLNSQNKPYLNLDLELLDETEVGEQIEDFNNVKMPHLLYPIYNSKDELQAIVAFGKFPGIYWQKSLAEAIYKLVEVFSGFYLNILVHEKYLEQGKAIVKEQEEKLYNQKIAELKTQQNEELKAEKKLITESIEYAALIQKSLVPQPKELELTLTKYFVVWQQRDIVGGDLYWSETVPNSDEVLFSVIDCTGHGIPGALMSVTANSSLERITKEHKCYEVDLILNQMHQSIGTTLHQSEKNTQQDGMDMSVIKFDKKSKQLQFAGAQHNLILIKGNSQELIIIKGDRYSIGGLKWKNEIKFNAHELQLDSGDTIYLFSDGIVDQPYQHSKTKLRRLGTKAWHDFLVEKNQQSINKIKTEIEELIAEMREISTQRDDICIVGIRIE